MYLLLVCYLSAAHALQLPHYSRRGMRAPHRCDVRLQSDFFSDLKKGFEAGLNPKKVAAEQAAQAAKPSTPAAPTGGIKVELPSTAPPAAPTGGIKVELPSISPAPPAGPPTAPAADVFAGMQTPIALDSAEAEAAMARIKAAEAAEAAEATAVDPPAAAPAGPPTAPAADVFAGMQTPIPLDSAEAEAAMARIKAAEAAEAAGGTEGSLSIEQEEEALFAEAVAAAQAAKAAADAKAAKPEIGISARVWRCLVPPRSLLARLQPHSPYPRRPCLPCVVGS